MSTDLTTFNGKAPSTAFATLNPQQESLSDGIGGGFGVIHYTGKNWSLVLRGTSYNFTRADDGSPLAYIDGIILRQLPVRSKTFYLKGAFERGEKGAPLCSSLDGVTPDANVKERQATACALCERNVTKLNAEGRMGRECRDNKRLAFLLLPTLSKALLGEPLMEPVLLRVPAASLTALARMGDDMARKGWHFCSYITRIGFVAEKPYPELTFRALQELTDKEGPIVMPMREEALAYRVTGESELGKPRPTAQIAVGPPTHTAPASQTTSAPVQTAAPRSNTVPPQNNLILDLQANAPDEVVDAGFGAMTEQPKAAASNVVQMAPVGETAESDDDLDARVRDLLKTS